MFSPVCDAQVMETLRKRYFGEYLDLVSYGQHFKHGGGDRTDDDGSGQHGGHVSVGRERGLHARRIVPVAGPLPPPTMLHSSAGLPSSSATNSRKRYFDELASATANLRLRLASSSATVSQAGFPQALTTATAQAASSSPQDLQTQALSSSPVGGTCTESSVPY
jgi:hypothetical protein